MVHVSIGTEFKGETAAAITTKMLRFPSLGKRIDETWNVALTRDIDVTNDRLLLKQTPEPNCVPLYEAKMIQQFTDHALAPRYWVDLDEARKVLRLAHVRRIRRLTSHLGRVHAAPDVEMHLDSNCYRSAYHATRRGADERTLVATVVPPQIMCNNSLYVSRRFDDIVSGDTVIVKPLLSNAQLLFLVAILNSFVIDFSVRRRGTANISVSPSYVYQLLVPRYGPDDRFFAEIVERSAMLICTTPDFDDLAREVGLGSHEEGVTNSVQRARLRAELDGMIAHLYGLTEDEFAHVLGTFPLVPAPVRVAAHNAYRDIERGLIP